MLMFINTFKHLSFDATEAVEAIFHISSLIYTTGYREKFFRKFQFYTRVNYGGCMLLSVFFLHLFVKLSVRLYVSICLCMSYMSTHLSVCLFMCLCLSGMKKE